jgi:hypothetical protein
MITDTERLEFLFGDNETQGYFTVRSKPDYSEWVVWDQSNGLELIGKGVTMREAIDTAMSTVNRSA